MSASSRVNVLRWTALAVGVFYGFTHQRSIIASQKAASTKREYDEKQSLINKAKEEYEKLHNPAPAAADAALRDPSSPKFDIEKYFEALAKEKS